MILLLGYGISNKSVEKILQKNNYEYKIFDGFRDLIDESILDNIDLIIRSPGITLAHPILMLANLRNIKIFSEIEFALQQNNLGIKCCVTGSNGKTSTLFYAYQILSKYYKDVILVGNNGNPYSSYVDKINKETIILLELSNFQLENTYSLKPFISVITNISQNHLDKVANYDEYIHSKLKILNDAQNIFLNFDDNLLCQINNDKINYVSIKENKDFNYLNNSIYYKNNLVIKNVNNKFLIGNHNKTNLLLAIAICHKLGLSFEQIDKVINKIKPVKYRLEYIKTINGVDVYNDGKSTTPSSVKASIESFENKNIHLILGGRNKGMDFSCLKNYDNVHFYVYGEVKDDLSVLLNSKKYNTFKEAYRDINAKKGEIIIYSPGCASFDQFKDYIERSKAFESMILNE